MITILLILAAIAIFGTFIYLAYILWSEISLTLQDLKQTQGPISRLAEELQTLQPLVQSLSANANQRAAEITEIIELSKATSAQVGTLVAAAGALRSPNVQLALRYGKDWIEDHRAHPLIRNFKRIVRKIQARLTKRQK